MSLYRSLIVLLLCTPFHLHAEVRYQTVTGAGGVPLSVASAGNPDNPAILFLHGIASSHYAFHHQLESALADEYFLIAPDLRGHGASGKPWESAAYGSSAPWSADVEAVLAATGARRPLVVAWSFGTLVAMDYLREAGADSVSGLLLTGAIGALKPYPLSSGDDPLAEEFQEARKLQLSPDPRDQVKASRLMVGWLTSATLPKEQRDVLQSIAMMFPTYARLAIYGRSLDNQDLLPALGELPMLLALGGNDNALMLATGEALAADHVNISMSYYAAAGHSVFMENPGRFTSELRDFAASLFADRPQTPEIAASAK